MAQLIVHYKAIMQIWRGFPKRIGISLQDRVIAKVESDTQKQAYFWSLQSLIVTRLFTFWFAQRISKFPGKILILWGERDRIVPPKLSPARRNL